MTPVHPPQFHRIPDEPPTITSHKVVVSRMLHVRRSAVTMHKSIVKGEFLVERCTTCCTLFHCPICPMNTVLDFGKIIIYTSNLRIIRAPPRKPEAEQHHGAHAEEPDIPPQDRPTKERPTRERPTREKPTRERPTRDTSPKDRPSKDASPKDRPSKDASPKDRPPKDRPTKDKPPKAKERGSRRRRAASTQPSEERGERQRKHAEDKVMGPGLMDLQSL
uniref:Uncharacterized protein n=1 Tax=Knipowitschia caucasica TaxID=637954 RepID=A0AAV2J9X8_KNICA